MPLRCSRFRLSGWTALWTLILWMGELGAADIDLERTQGLYRKGDYTNCIRECEVALGERLRSEEWPSLLAQAQMALGRYAAARATLAAAIERNRGSIRLRLLAHRVYRANGDLDGARQQLIEINELGSSRIWNYRDAPNLVALGQAALLLGADPKLVLERFLDPARKAEGECPEAYLASGELALDKHDYELAARLFGEAVKKFKDDPELHYGLARAFAPNARPRMVASLETALRLNPNHAPSLLLMADHAVDAEEYATARELVDQVLSVNPWQPEAWAYRALLCHLTGDSAGEAAARANGLHFWSSNPAVDHLIGRKLSQNYRFREGAARQREALRLEASYLPAQIQLAQDLLRLGQEDEGWQLAQQVHQQDGYDVTAFNLVTLQETLGKFTTLTNAHFVVRMTAREAALYGDRVLALLERARGTLGAKYRVTQEEPVVVEIFADQKDFAVRTFGMPHNPGFLGVCFGNVVTANSPAAQSRLSNWEAVLWHEFAHVLTLHVSRNKMPRWLSEGLSVYEERQANPAWGQHMNSRYREMVLNGELTPVGELSAAFLSPKSDLHLQFAYYQSSLVAEFIVERFGWETILKILSDLGKDRPINETITAHTLALPSLEKEFDAFARKHAQNLAPGLDWEQPPGFKNRISRSAGGSFDLPRVREDENQRGTPNASDRPLVLEPAAWPAARLATNYWALRQRAETAMEAARWEEARAALEILVRQYPQQNGPDDAYALLATVHRQRADPTSERKVLDQWARVDADAADAYGRLMDLGAAERDWESVRTNADRFLAVNPLVARPYQQLAEANEALGRSGEAILAWRRLLLLGAPDPAEAHFRLARLLQREDLPSARRHVLQALEDAPRFREAHRLLLELNARPGNTQGAGSTPPGPTTTPLPPAEQKPG